MAIGKFVAAAGALAMILGTPSLASAEPKAKAAATAKGWTGKIVETKNGWRMGNPDAPYKLVEYLSLNCGHCATLAEQKLPLFKKLVASGRMSLEYRPMTIFPWDTVSTTLARCVAPAKRFAFTHDYMKQQDAVRGELEKLLTNRAQVEKIQAALEKDKPFFLKSLAKAGGMYAIAARHGVDAASANACMEKADAVFWADSRSAEASAKGVTGTPTLYLNDEPLDPSGLYALETTVSK